MIQIYHLKFLIKEQSPCFRSQPNGFSDQVKKELIKLGVPKDCLKAVGRGTSQLITQAEGKEAQAPNRRVEIKFIYPQ